VSAWSLPPDAFEFLRSRLSPEATVVELGSGEGTRRLVDSYARVFSVEHDEKFVGKYGSTYIHAPIVDGWYDRTAIAYALPSRFDCVIVDGPPGNIGRQGVLRHLDLFGPVPMLVDDVHRPAEREVILAIAQARQQRFSIHCLPDGRGFATIGWPL
jgi:hypothetical protein